MKATGYLVDGGYSRVGRGYVGWVEIRWRLQEVGWRLREGGWRLLEVGWRQPAGEKH